MEIQFCCDDNISLIYNDLDNANNTFKEVSKTIQSTKARNKKLTVIVTFEKDCQIIHTFIIKQNQEYTDIFKDFEKDILELWESCIKDRDNNKISDIEFDTKEQNIISDIRKYLRYIW